jgi:hypothetical protein
MMLFPIAVGRWPQVAAIMSGTPSPPPESDPDGAELLSGDMQSGTDALLTSGDMQSGTDVIQTSIEAP